MKHGYIENVITRDIGSSCVRVCVDFMVNRADVYKFLDCLMPTDEYAPREPIEAILNHSCEKAVEK